MARGVRRARTAAVGAAAATLLAAAAGCSDEAAKKQPEAAPSASTSTSASSASPRPTVTVPVADPEHAMDPPGPFEGALVVADILVYSDESLSEEVVEKIGKLPGVRTVEHLSLANVSIENSVYTVAAVDPSTYRHFSTAGKQDEIWARVAGGELAAPQEVAGAVADDEAFVRLGADADAPKVHVGAYAPQAGGVDMVVNEEWGKDLFEVRDNALLIYTGMRSPASLRKPIEQLLEPKTSIQMLDVVARFGLDPGAYQTAIPTGGDVASAVGAFSYRVVGNRVQPDPAWVAANIVTDTVPLLGRVSCHRAMMGQLKSALQEVVAQRLGRHVYQTAGCFYPRFIANTQRLSNHAFGTAIDINSLENGRGIRGQMHPEVVAIFKKWGFAWGGDWAYTDPMHFELNAIVQPG